MRDVPELCEVMQNVSIETRGPNLLMLKKLCALDAAATTVLSVGIYVLALPITARLAATESPLRRATRLLTRSQTERIHRLYWAILCQSVEQWSVNASCGVSRRPSALRRRVESVATFLHSLSRVCVSGGRRGSRYGGLAVLSQDVHDDILRRSLTGSETDSGALPDPYLPISRPEARAHVLRRQFDGRQFSPQCPGGPLCPAPSRLARPRRL